jgi:uncharacterized protein YheU (UPF0270 family)
MAKILITTDNQEVIETQGKMTFETVKRFDEDGDAYFETIGQLAIHEYIDHIVSIESARYLLKGVDVYREVYGTDDFNILYEFTLEEGTDVIVKESSLDKKKIELLKEREYSNEDCKEWEGDYEWISEMK